MKKEISVAVVSIICISVTFAYCARKGDSSMISSSIKSIKDAQNFFPKHVSAIEVDTKKALAQALQMIDALIAIPKEKRTFENTARALDTIIARADAAVLGSVYFIVKELYPDQQMRQAGTNALKKIEEFFVDHVGNNKKIYHAFKEYAEGNALAEDLTPEQRYFITETLDDFKRAGLDLPDAELKKVGDLKKKLQDLELQYDRNIAEDNRTIAVSKDELAGIDSEFIENLRKDDSGNYILGVDYPTYFHVMAYSDYEPTRKRLYEQSSNRGYPKNETIIKEIIALRDELAKMLGYKSFAHLNIDKQMVQTPERAAQFLAELQKRAEKKELIEIQELIKELPQSVTCMPDGKIKSWDIGFLKTRYKEKKFNIDEKKIAEYFPMQQTVEQLLDIYRIFLNVEFVEVPISDMWHGDVRLIKVYNADKSQLYGYLFMDLYPRPDKYSHAAHAGLIPSMKLADGTRLPGVSVLMANFTKPTKSRPSLLKRDEVKTFFHEFGHAMHSILGATELASHAGTSVKTDFVELPSQMLEEWMYDKGTLKKISHHYETGESLSDEIVDNIIALKRYDAGSFVTRQAMLAQYALKLYEAGADKDPYKILHDVLAESLPHAHYGPEYRLYCNFGHLTGYGAKYYGYLWSKVFALDLFDTIKQHGLLNTEMGQKYVREIIGCGGSKDPNELLKNFLGREPRQDAFIRDLGLE